jgi:ketosteroid isomerase-like protein
MVGRMAQADIDVIRESHEAFRRRDLGAFLGYIDPDVEFRSHVLELEGAYHGHEGVRAWWDNVVAMFPEWSPRMEEAREIGDSVLVRVRAEGKGTGSGVPLERDIWQVVQVRDGRLRSWAFYRTEQEALEALALSD